MEHLADLHPSRAHLEGHLRDRGQEVTRTSPRPATRSSAADRTSSPSARSASSSGSRPTRTTGAASPPSARSSSASSATDDAMAQALKKGEIDFADSLTPNVFNVAAGRRRHHHGARPSYSGFDELAFNTGAALTTARPIGDGNPLLKDKQAAPGDRLGHRPARRWSTRSSAATASPASTIIPPIYANLHLRPGQPRSPTTRRRPSRCSTPRATRSAATASARRPTAARLSLPAVRPVGLPDVEEVGRVHQGLPRRQSASRSRSSSSRSDSRSPRRSVRASTTCSSGAGSSSPTRTTSCRRSPAASGPTRTAAAIYADLSDSFYCNPAYDALYEQQAGETDAGQARGDRQADAADALRRRAVRRDRSTTTTSRPTAPTGSPGSCRSPTPNGAAAVPVRHLDLREHRAGRGGDGDSRAADVRGRRRLGAGSAAAIVAVVVA